MAKENSVVLLSGGLDSAVLLSQVHETGGALPLFIDYGQRAVARERAAAEAQCRALGLELMQFDTAAVGKALYAGTTNRPHSPLPYRNLVLVSLALSYAEWAQAGVVTTAIIRDDLGSYACTLASFWYALRDLAASLGDIHVETPFIYLDKAAVIGEGLLLGVDFTRTYSCRMGHDKHCGRCRQCAHRRTSAARAGLSEPDDFYLQELLPAPRSTSAAPPATQASTSGAWRW